jgi:hypothetical protein
MADSTLRMQMVESQRLSSSEMERIANEVSEDELWETLLENVPTASPAEFHIDSDERADWLLRKVADCQARAVRAKAWAAREVASAEADEGRLVARFAGELEAYARSLGLTTAKKKSRAVPSGVFGFRKQPARLVVTDDAKALEWAKKNAPVAVVIVPATEKLSKADLATAFKPNGVIPDGAEVTDEKDVFFFK